MSVLGFSVFETALGHVGLAWSERGVLGVQLPEAGESATRARLARRFPGARETTPPPALAPAVAGIVALLRGERSDLCGVPLDLSRVEPFACRVYEVARTIAPGETLSYGEIARRLGEPDAARAVGEALARNPLPILVPCHRVLAAGGRLGGVSARGGVATKRRLLALEGAAPNGQPELFG